MRVMIISHDPERRNRIKEHFSSRGYEMLTPLHREDILKTLQQSHPQAIILDLFITEPNGGEILKRLRVAGYTGKVIALAGTGSYTSLADCWRLGVDQVVTGLLPIDGPLDMTYVETGLVASFQKEIAQRVFELREQEGRPDGPNREYWTQAVRELVGERGCA